METARTITLYDDGSVREFAAKVLSCEEVNNEENTLYAVILDKTAFFPEGGGQCCDGGTIDDVAVRDVQETNGVITHYVAKAFEVGSTVKGVIDYPDRYMRMQNHTAEHLLCSLIHEKYGFDNVGFHLDNDEVTMDVSGFVPPEDLCEIEKRANEIIYENVPVTVSYPVGKELEDLEYRSKLDLTDNVRIVTIEGYDVCACCAPHVASTAQIGIIKIIDSIPHRGGTRITMKAGVSAYRDYSKIHSSTVSLMALLSSKRYDTYDNASGLNERYKNAIITIGTLKRQISESMTKAALEEIDAREDKSAPYVIFTDVIDDVGLRNLINEVTKKCEGVVIGFIKAEGGGYRYIAGTSNEKISLRELAKNMSTVLSGRGGGSNQMIQGMVNAEKSDVEEFFAEYGL